MKTCSICGKEKDLNDFHRNKKGAMGRDSRCAACKNEQKRNRDSSLDGKAKNSEYVRSDKYKENKKLRRWSGDYGLRMIEKEINRLNNKEIASFRYVSRVEAKELGLARYFEGAECKRGHISERNTANNECLGCCEEKRKTQEYKDRKSSYYISNRDSLMARNVERQRERYSESPDYKCSVAVRNMLKRVLKSTKTNKRNKSIELIGYTPSDLRRHIESLLLDGMDWDNYGDWHIDHIKPVSLMIKEGITDPALINSLSNLQPLWAEENFAKRDSFEG